ncbi:hypothetical protein PUNSTDRAFT_41779 [Punctularia strigosozonata HHB-11173 SS5]|uniref:uncharacterized protein n=1 Tax=Punctularia strigosozonata (strain HHB-11173) TaxID=741275 RepID=UPI0004417C76|nr:uncharacterized protein PUNSTDRAFT_41779 [Punctularia strigosozonata HHB-11173 SS5]EIN14634.1 hypothetical protein PUNSTDRAFT_41779 [Punctularia strigosozonata HHB-11173 SS5]
MSSLTLLTFIVYCRVYGSGRKTLDEGVRGFMNSTMGKYLISLMVVDFIQGCAFTLNFLWARHGHINVDGVCVAQAILSQIGDLGIALWCVTLANTDQVLRNCNAYFLAHSISIEKGDVGPSGEKLVGFNALAQRYSLDGISGAWCWISSDYEVDRVPFLYAWVFLTIFVSSIIYALIYLKFSGFIGMDLRGRPTGLFQWTKWTTPSTRQSMMHIGGSTGHSSGSGDGSVSHHAHTVAKRLMWLPIIYMVVVIPVAICRIGSLAGWEPPFWFFVFAGICFASSGTSDSILFLFTRHTLIQNALHKPRTATAVHITRQQITVCDDDQEDARSPRKVNFPVELNSIESRDKHDQLWENSSDTPG